MTLTQSPAKLRIGAIVRNAVVFNFRKNREAAMNSESLLGAVEHLFELLDARRVQYVLVGGIALLQYVEGRNTDDLDLIMALPSLLQLPEIEIVNQDANFARGKYGDLQIDILLTHNPLFAQVARERVALRPFAEREVPCATVEGLLLLKLYALPSLYRQGNFARVAIYESDISTLLHDYQPPLEALVAELAAYLNESDLAAIRDILAEIQVRIKRFGTIKNE